MSEEYDFSYFVIYLPKIIKNLFKFDEVMTEIVCAVFIETRCI